MPVFACAYACTVHEVAASRSSFRPRLFPRLDCQQPSGSTRLRAVARLQRLLLAHALRTLASASSAGRCWWCPVALQPGRTDSALALIVEVGTLQVRCQRTCHGPAHETQARQGQPRLVPALGSHGNRRVDENVDVDHNDTRKQQHRRTCCQSQHRSRRRTAKSHVPVS